MEELGWSLCLVEYKEINHFITTEELIKLNMDFIKKKKKQSTMCLIFFFFCTIPVMKTFHCLHGCQDDCLKCALYHCITVTDSL